MTGSELVKSLQRNGYFDHTNKHKLQAVQDSLIKHFDTYKEFMTLFDSKSPYLSFDLRLYDCGDGEALFEEGGVVELLKDMQPFLNQIHVRLSYSDDSYVNNFHSIIVNGRSYVLAEGSSLMWGETIAKFADMLNAELRISNSRERIYLLTNENEYMVFLTQEQYEILSANLKNEKKPFTVSEWSANKANEIKNLIK